MCIVSPCKADLKTPVSLSRVMAQTEETFLKLGYDIGRTSLLISALLQFLSLTKDLDKTFFYMSLFTVFKELNKVLCS